MGYLHWNINMAFFVNIFSSHENDTLISLDEMLLVGTQVLCLLFASHSSCTPFMNEWPICYVNTILHIYVLYWLVLWKKKKKHAPAISNYRSYWCFSRITLFSTFLKDFFTFYLPGEFPDNAKRETKIPLANKKGNKNPSTFMKTPSTLNLFVAYIRSIFARGWKDKRKNSRAEKKVEQCSTFFWVHER